MKDKQLPKDAELFEKSAKLQDVVKVSCIVIDFTRFIISFALHENNRLCSFHPNAKAMKIGEYINKMIFPILQVSNKTPSPENASEIKVFLKVLPR